MVTHDHYSWMINDNSSEHIIITTRVGVKGYIILFSTDDTKNHAKNNIIMYIIIYSET